MRFQPNDLVVSNQKIRPHTSYEIYKVVAIINGHCLLEHYGSAWEGEIHKDDYEWEPGSRNWSETYIRYQEKDLITPEEYLVEKKKLEAEESRLEGEFKAVRSQFRENLDKAADLINQSTTMAEACQKDIRSSLKIDYQTLFHALDRAGWSASFTRC